MTGKGMGDCGGLRPGGSFFASWSGGKDSCLALYRATQAGGELKRLLTMLVERGGRSHSHGLPLEVLRAQAAALGVPITFRATSWGDYERHFIDALKEIAAAGVEAGVFGDIDIEAHREWVERVCGEADLAACEPLWRIDRRALLDEFMDAGFVARVVMVRGGVLDPDFLGRTLDRALIAEFAALGIDASGENGEYHTVVTEGPIFSSPLALAEGERIQRSGCWFLDVALAGPGA